MTQIRTEEGSSGAEAAAIGIGELGPGGVGPGGMGTGGIDVLAGVELVSFTAKPAHIGPFGASRLAWDVKGPRGFGVRLNNAPVARIGHKIVQPQSTARYRLDAVSAGATQFVGEITVQVNTSRCENNSLFRPDVTIRGLVDSQVAAQKGIYFRDDTEIIFSPGTIRLKLHLGKEQNNFPDPEVEIDASFGLVVQQGHVVSVAKTINVDISVPFYAWAIPGAVPGLAIAISMSTDSARKSTGKIIEGIGRLIDFVSVFSNQDLIKHSVRIGVDDDGQGTIDVRACPDDLLVKFAKLSATSVR